MKVKIHLIATDKSSTIWINNVVGAIEKLRYTPSLEAKQTDIPDYVPQHLYYTSSEEIKEGDWVITKTGYLRQCTHTRPIGDKYICLSKDNLVLTSHCRKIVATTNPELWGETTVWEAIHSNIADLITIPKISTSDIEAYIKAYNVGNPVLELELEEDRRGSIKFWTHYYRLREFDNMLTPDTFTWNSSLKLSPDGCVITLAPAEERKYTRADILRIYNEHVVESSKPRESGSMYFEEWLDKRYP